MRKLLVGMALLLSAASCGKKEDAAPDEQLGPPVFQLFFPQAAPVGATLTLLGRQFSPTAAHNTGRFTGGADVAAFWSNPLRPTLYYDSLRVRVPAGAASGPLALRVGQQQVAGPYDFILTTGHWTRKADFPGGGGLDGTGFTVGGKTYLLRPGTNDMWAYDPAANAWARKASCPVGTVEVTSNSGGQLSFVANGRGYVGVHIDKYPFNGVRWFAYDPATDSWAALPDLGNTSVRSAVAFGLNNKGYVVNLESTFSPPSVWEFDPATNLWSYKGQFPGVGRYAALSFAVGGRGYVGSGTAGNLTSYTDFWEYDPLANRWARKADVPAASFARTGFAANGQGFLNATESISKGVYAYTPQTDSWARQSDFIGSAYSGTVPVTAEGRAYVARGRGIFNDLYAEFWEFTPN